MKAQTMRSIRKYHYWIGVFFAPALVLFALSGALQTFRLQDVKGWGGTPPQWIAWIASVHIDQTLPEAKPEKPKVIKAAVVNQLKVSDEEADHKSSPLPLKIFVVLLSVGLIISVLLGVSISLNSIATRKGAMIMLLAGCILPLGLLLL